MSKVQLPWLDASNSSAPFPNAEDALNYPEGLVAAGGDLSSVRILRAYREGIFPWYEQGQPILWWSPNPRGVLYPRDFVAHRSLLRSIRRQQWRVTYNQAFRAVVVGCAEPRAYSTNTWITQEMLNAYCDLHQLQYAHSVEVWDKENNLIGGIYGISLGSIFFGESMFSRKTDASKAALLYLCAYVDTWGYRIIDTQLPSAHLRSLGGVSMPRTDYIKLAKQCVTEQSKPHAWQKQVELNIGLWVKNKSGLLQTQ